jgi:lipid A 3-O-deacylase
MQQNIYLNACLRNPVKTITILLLCLLVAFSANAQQYMARVYEDNDLFNVISKATDDAYTNGLRFDLSFVKDHRSKFFLDRWLPKAGDSAVNVFSYGLMQLMFTPQHITKPKPDIDDYPYSGALLISHVLYSSNPEKKYNFQTEILAGAIGTPSLAEQTQVLVHKVINDYKPMGWQYQLPTAPLFNINFAAEKMIWHLDNAIELIGGGQAMAGTLMDGAQVYSIVRLGIMNPYFDGSIAQNSGVGAKKLQLYFYGKPSVQWTGYNAMVDGALFRGKSDYYRATDGVEMPATSNRGLELNMEMGAALAWKNIGLSFSQKIMAPMLNAYHHHTVGNISLYMSW